MEAGEHERAVGDPAFRDRLELLPTRTNIGAGDFEPSKQRNGIGDIAEIVGFVGANPLVVQAKRAVEVAELDAKQREMPEQMVAEVVAVFERAGVGTRGSRAPSRGPAGHLMHMDDGVEAPGVARRALERTLSKPLRLPIGPGLLEREGKAAEQIAEMGMIEPGASDDALDRTPACRVRRPA